LTVYIDLPISLISKSTTTNIQIGNTYTFGFQTFGKTRTKMAQDEKPTNEHSVKNVCSLLLPENNKVKADEIPP
jgi:hypothetical protein